MSERPGSAGGSGRTAILRVESSRHLRSSLALTIVLLVFVALYTSMFPGFGEDAEELAEAFPEFVFDMFDIEALHTFEGFIAAEMYSFFWTILVGVYFAYLGASMIAVDVNERRMDLTLSNPVSRESVLLQKLASLWVPLVMLNVTVAGAIYVGSVLIGETVNPVALAMVHLLSIPYLLVCAGIGLLLSVALGHPRSAKTGAIGLVIVLWLVDAISRMTGDFEWIGAVAPSRYYGYTAILVREEYALLDAGVLLAAFVVLIAVATALFVRRDI